MGRRKFLSVMLGGILCLGNMVTLRSQSRLDSLQHLDEVVVTVRALPKEVIPVQQLAGEQLSRLSSHSVADALRYFSGLQIKDYGGVGGLKTVNIRSMGTNHVGVFYDGVELGNAQNGTVDLGRFSLDNMESVTLYNGQKSAIFSRPRISVRQVPFICSPGYLCFPEKNCSMSRRLSRRVRSGWPILPCCGSGS